LLLQSFQLETKLSVVAHMKCWWKCPC